MSGEAGALNRIGKNFLSLSFAEILTKVTGMVLYVYLARYLGPEEFGVYSVAITISTILLLFADMGFDSVLIKEVSRNPEKAAAYFSHSLFVKLCSGAVCFIICLAIVHVMAYPPETTRVIILFALTLFVAPAAGAMNALFKSFQRMEYSSLSQIVGKLLVFIIIMTLIHLHAKLAIIVTAHAAVTLIVFLFFFFVVRKRILPRLSFSIDRNLLRNIFRESFPFFMVGAIYIVNARVNILMLSKLSGMREVGIFNAANEMIMVLFMIPSIVSTVLFPVLSQQYSNAPDKLAKTACYAERILLSIGIPLGMGLFMIAPQVLGLTYGSKYVDAVPAFRILAVALSLVFARSIMGWLLAAMDKVKIVMWINLGSLVINVFLNLLLIPAYGHLGAAVTTAVSLVFSNVVSIAVVCKVLPGLTIFRDYLRPGAAAIMMAAVLYVLPTWNIAFLILMGILTYITVFYLLRGFHMEEWVIVRKMVRDRA